MYQNALREERSEIYVWLYQAVHYLFKPSGSHAHVSESEQLTLNLSVKEPLRRQDAPADCTLNARHSLVPSSCVAGGSLSILNSSLDSSSEPSFPTNAQISVRLDKETMLTFLYWCKQFKKKLHFWRQFPHLPSPPGWCHRAGRSSSRCLGTAGSPTRAASQRNDSLSGDDRVQRGM